MQYFIFLRVLITIPSLFHRFLASFFKLEVFLQYLGILGCLFTFKCQMLRSTEEVLCVVGVARGGVSPLTGQGVRFHWRNSCLRCQCQSMQTFSPVAHFSGKALSGICQTVGLPREAGGELQAVT